MNNNMPAPVLKIFSMNERALKLNLQDISHTDSVKKIENCNTINWITGHLVYSRNIVTALLGLPPAANEKYKAIYERGTNMTDFSTAEKQETLVQLYNDSQSKIIESIAKIKDEQVLEKLALHGFHEAYHIGQVGILRKLLGKEGAIK